MLQRILPPATPKKLAGLIQHAADLWGLKLHTSTDIPSSIEGELRKYFQNVRRVEPKFESPLIVFPAKEEARNIVCFFWWDRHFWMAHLHSPEEGDDEGWIVSARKNVLTPDILRGILYVHLDAYFTPQVQDCCPFVGSFIGSSRKVVTFVSLFNLIPDYLMPWEVVRVTLIAPNGKIYSYGDLTHILLHYWNVARKKVLPAFKLIYGNVNDAQKLRRKRGLRYDLLLVVRGYKSFIAIEHDAMRKITLPLSASADDIARAVYRELIYEAL